MKKLISACNECDALRSKDVNGWSSILGDFETPEFMSFDEAEKRDPEKDVPTEKRKTPRADFCGAGCLTAAFNGWVSNGTIAKGKD